MTLISDVSRAQAEFNNMSADDLLDILDRVCQELRTADTREYLRSKINAARNVTPQERHTVCKKLLPYLDWYVKKL